jgi:hypothetical protein
MWGNLVVGVLLAKFFNGQVASFVRSEGELFVINVNGEEQTMSREIWRQLPEQRVQEKDRIDLDHHRRHSEPRH